MASAPSQRRLRARKPMTEIGTNGKPQRSRTAQNKKSKDLKPCRKRGGLERMVQRQDVKQLKVRLLFEESPPNPRDQDDVEWYECIQDIARHYNDLKKHADEENCE